MTEVFAPIDDPRHRQADGNGEARASNCPLLDPRDPMAMARVLVDYEFTAADQRAIHHYKGVFHRWNGARYIAMDEGTVRAVAWTFLDRAACPNAKDKPKPFMPKPTNVNALVDALSAVANLPGDVEPPVWIDGGARPAATDILPVGNGLLHLPSGVLLPPTPAFFALHGTNVDFDPAAPPPEQLLDFLAEVFGDDVAAIETLQDWAGYCLTPDTSQQKMLMLVGLPRSGKGTIGRLLTHIVGKHSVAAPTLSGLTTNFGLAPLIGKSLAVISDARLGSRTDQAQVAERLLSISGEDSLTIDRKFRPAWTGRLPTRVMLLTNELPRIADASSALAKRFLILLLKNSFYGREDPALTGKLLAEAPSILNWARAGYLRLRDRGYFVQPTSGRDAVEDMETLASPVRAFVRDRCTIQPGAETPVGELYGDWKFWCEDNGGMRPGPANVFSGQLKTAFPGIEVVQKRSERSDERQRYFVGIKRGHAL